MNRADRDLCLTFLFEDVAVVTNHYVARTTYTGLPNGYPCRQTNLGWVLPECMRFAHQLHPTAPVSIVSTTITTRPAPNLGREPWEELPGLFAAALLSHVEPNRWNDPNAWRHRIVGWFQDSPRLVAPDVRMIRWSPRPPNVT